MSYSGAFPYLGKGFMSYFFGLSRGREWSSESSLSTNYQLPTYAAAVALKSTGSARETPGSVIVMP